MINFGYIKNDQSQGSWYSIDCGCSSCVTFGRRLKGLFTHLVVRNYSLTYAQSVYRFQQRAKS